MSGTGVYAERGRIVADGFGMSGFSVGRSVIEVEYVDNVIRFLAGALERAGNRMA